MLWFLAALVASVAQAMSFDVNRTLRMNAVVLVYWRSLLTLPLFLPVLLVADITVLPPVFWWVCVCALHATS